MVVKLVSSMPGEEESDSEGQAGATWEHQSLAQVKGASRSVARSDRKLRKNLIHLYLIRLQTNITRRPNYNPGSW